MSSPNPYPAPAAPPDQLRVIREHDDSQVDGAHSFRLVDAVTGRVLARGVGFNSAASRDEAITITLRRAMGLRPRPANPTAVGPSTRRILARYVDSVWGRP